MLLPSKFELVGGIAAPPPLCWTTGSAKKLLLPVGWTIASDSPRRYAGGFLDVNCAFGMSRSAVDVPNATGVLTVGPAVGAATVVALLAADARGVEPAERIASESASGIATTTATYSVISALRFDTSLLMRAPSIGGQSGAAEAGRQLACQLDVEALLSCREHIPLPGEEAVPEGRLRDLCSSRNRDTTHGGQPTPPLAGVSTVPKAPPTGRRTSRNLLVQPCAAAMSIVRTPSQASSVWKRMRPWMPWPANAASASVT